MGMNRKYSGFTLVEMLIVMGIIIILMAVGIAAGRFAIQRANDVAHQNAADQLFTAVQSYLTDEREYPTLEGLTNGWADALADGGILNEYLSIGEFRGGTDATYYYWTDTRAALVCVSLGGFDDVDGRGYYCTGNGFGADGAPLINEKDVENSTGTTEAWPAGTTGWLFKQPWDNGDSTTDPAFGAVVTGS